jgi:hypothetical protein
MAYLARVGAWRLPTLTGVIAEELLWEIDWGWE